MKIATLLIFFLICSPLLRSEEKKEAPREYGERNAQTIAIRVEGEVKKPGIHHVHEGIIFSEFIERAGRGLFSNGRFAVTRTLQGKTESIYIRYDREKKMFTPDIKLVDGDFLYASFNMAQKEPNQSSQPTSLKGRG